MEVNESTRCGPRRRIVGPVRQDRITQSSPEVQTYRYREITTCTVTTEVKYGWLLECGHVLSGQDGHGKKSKDCYLCEWATRGDASYVAYAAENPKGWHPLSDEEAFERLHRL